MVRDFQTPGRSPVFAREAAAATSHPLATSAALEILQSGGNAVDAAIAAAAVQAVVEPQMTGIGGDCFAIVMEPDGRMAGFNGSGAAPKASSVEALISKGVSEIEPTSVHAVTVPGAIRAWETLSRAHGQLKFSDLFKRAIDYAENGFPVAPRVYHDWCANEDKLRKHKATERVYLPGGKVPEIGQIVKFPRLAETLKEIAAKGSEAFYEGAVADDIIATLEDLGGLMVHDDLSACHTTAVSPIMRDYRGHTLAELPPNGQGVIALVILGLLERFEIGKLDPLSQERLHLHMEATKIAYAVRERFVSDQGYMDACPTRLISGDYLDELASMIDAQKRNTETPVPVSPPQTDTIYLSVVDKDGLAVSFINSLFAGFGSGILAAESGVLLHNRGLSFSLDPSHVNAIAGGKRPMHTIIPAMGLKDGHPWMSFGVMGGHYQACGHAWVLSNIVDFGMDVQQAIDLPRVFFDMKSHVLEVEKGVPSETVTALEAMGHEVKVVDSAIGGSQAIMIDRKKGLLVAGSDPRKDGHAAGY